MFPFSVTKKLSAQAREQPGCELIAFDAEKLNVFAADVHYCEPHWHPAPELILVLSGSFSVNVGQRCHTPQAGDILYINAEEIHYLEARMPGSSLLTVQFSPGLFDETHQAPHLNYCCTPRQTPLSAQDDTVFQTLINLMEYLVHGETSFRRISAIYLLLDALEKAGDPEPRGQICAHDSTLIKKSIEYINLHYDEDLCLSQLADQAGVSYHHFSRLFKKVSNHNFKEYLTLVRTNKAKQLLKDTQIPITEISHICGFREHKHLIFAFNKYCGMTPTELRKRYISNLNLISPTVNVAEDFRCLPLNNALLDKIRVLARQTIKMRVG